MQSAFEYSNMCVVLQLSIIFAIYSGFSLISSQDLRLDTKTKFFLEIALTRVISRWDTVFADLILISKGLQFKFNLGLQTKIKVYI